MAFKLRYVLPNASDLSALAGTVASISSTNPNFGLSESSTGPTGPSGDNSGVTGPTGPSGYISYTLSELTVTNFTGTNGFITNLGTNNITGETSSFSNTNTNSLNSIDSTLNVGTTSGTINVGCGTDVQIINVGTNSGGTTINLGGINDEIVIQGTLVTVDTTNLAVQDKNIVLNMSGTAGSAFGAGISIMEGGNTGAASILVSPDRSGWIMKPPAGTTINLNQSLSTLDNVEFNSIKLVSGAGENKVLTSDNIGNGVWTNRLQPYSSVITYSTGEYTTYNNTLYESLGSNLGNIPDAFSITSEALYDSTFSPNIIFQGSTVESYGTHFTVEAPCDLTTIRFYHSGVNLSSLVYVWQVSSGLDSATLLNSYVDPQASSSTPEWHDIVVSPTISLTPGVTYTVSRDNNGLRDTYSPPDYKPTTLITPVLINFTSGGYGVNGEWPSSGVDTTNITYYITPVVSAVPTWEASVIGTSGATSSNISNTIVSRDASGLVSIEQIKTYQIDASLSDPLDPTLHSAGVLYIGLTTPTVNIFGTNTLISGATIGIGNVSSAVTVEADLLNMLSVNSIILGGGSSTTQMFASTFTLTSPSITFVGPISASSSITCRTLNCATMSCTGTASVKNLILSTTGGTGSLLSYYEDNYQWPAVLIGPVSATTFDVNLSITRLGNNVDIVIPSGITTTANLTTAWQAQNSSSYIPVRFRPSIQSHFPICVIDNSVSVPGIFLINTDGSFYISPLSTSGIGTAGTFTASGQSAVFPSTVRYRL